MKNYFIFLILNLLNSLSKFFLLHLYLIRHILKDMPKGTKLYFENQDINSIIDEFKFLL